MDPVFKFAPVQPRTQASFLPVWALGFRPFFLGAAVWALLLIGLWIFALTGVYPLAYPNPIAWHGHEMVFGYTLAVIAGFLLTAARNWTGVPTPTGRSLAALFGLWLAGRIVMALPVPGAMAFAVDAAFLPVLCFVIAMPIVKARNWRNLAFVPMLLSFATLNILFHTLPEYATQFLYGAIGIVIVMITLVGGRIVPGFTQSGLANVKVVRLQWADWAAMVCTLALVPLDIFGIEQGVKAVAFTAGIFHLLRMAGWKSSATLRKPILWVLHLGYLFIPIGLLMRSLPSIIPTPVALHALTVGGIGLLTLGMMTRVSLGHTGRKLEASKLTVTSYVLLSMAVLTRVLGPLVIPDEVLAVHTVTAVAWIGAFTLYLFEYTPILLRPRPDGKVG